MSSFSTTPVNPSLDSSNLEQLKDEALALEDGEQDDEARAKYQKVAAIQTETLGEHHSDKMERPTVIARVVQCIKHISIQVATSAYSFLAEKGEDIIIQVLGSVYSFLGGDEETYQRKLVTHGVDHPETLVARFDMAFSLYEQKRYVDAISMLEPLLEKQTRVLPLDHPDTLTTILCIVDTLTQLKRHEEAIDILETLLPKLIRLLGEDHDTTLEIMRDTATALFSLDRYDAANQTATRGLLIAKRVGNEKQAARVCFSFSCNRYGGGGRFVVCNSRGVCNRRS
jgi:tetratricopeptide (TPR) repeat protein